MTIKHILVVDDSPTEALYITDILQKGGYTVAHAADGEEALQRLNTTAFDLILMDVVMPGQNGYQVTRGINKDERFKDIPIIMCTTKGLETDRIWGLRQGAKDYVVKPVNGVELLTKIANLNKA